MFDKVVQICSVLGLGDGISNIVRDYSIVLSEYNIDNCILSENIDSEYIDPELRIFHTDTLSEHITPKTLVIYHKSNSTELSYRIIDLQCPKVLLWHNFTPPVFFEPYDSYMFDLAKKSIRELAVLAPFFPYGWGDSQYNCDELQKVGYKRTDTLHPPYDFNRFVGTCPSVETANKKNEINILFVGRIAPNKRQEDVIRAFYYFHQLNPKSRLTLIGNPIPFSNYKQELMQLVSKLSVPVSFTNIVPIDELIAYYRSADLFLCMSEHEGLCIPIFEAMYFEVPIVAFASSAVPETLGETGIVFYQKHFPSVAHLMNAVLNNRELTEKMKEAGKRRVRHFSKEYSSKRLISLVEAYAYELGI